MISCQNVIRHELIGLDVLVSGAANPLHKGVNGHIIDETRNLVAIQTQTGIKKIPKLGSIFRLALPDNTLVEIIGSALILAPEKRLKRA
ncbi:MAG: ribonuclease P protein subunit [Methanoregula sp.]|jgi:ribonuclease P protein subunit POP4